MDQHDDRGLAPRLDPYRELFERSADAILIIEGETFVDCNQATVEMLRYEDKQQLLETHPSELSPPTQADGRESRKKASEMINIAFERGSHRFEWEHLRADGSVIPVEVLLTAVQRDGKRILHVVWRDLTERKDLEKQLRHAQKMEAIGRLAGGIAHDFNNLLVAIVGNSELLASELEGQPELRETVREIQQAGGRAAALVRQLLTFSREQEVQPRVVDVNEVLSHLHGFLERLIGEDVRIVAVPADEEVHVRIDPSQLEQVIVNLVTNARDSLPDGGTVTVDVRRTELGADAAGRFGLLEPGTFAVVSVADTGAGMDEETALRAFDPFFTTKDPGKGTGLGLATVYGIAQQSGGGATIVSELGEGTTVRVALPASLEDVHPDPLFTDQLPTHGGNETILVVEDDESVSSLVCRILTRKGYQLLLARTGAEALELWKSHEGEIDLLLSDVVMPVMGGPELVQRLRALGAEPRVLFSSGHTNNALSVLESVEGELELIEKPFSVRELAGRVRLALDRN